MLRVYFKKIINVMLLINVLILLIFIGGFIYFNDKFLGDESISKIEKKSFLCDTPVYKYYSSDIYLTDSSIFKDKIINDLKSVSIPNVETISVRFIINCRGEMDGFTYEAFDENLNKRKLDEIVKKRIFSTIKEIKHMPIGTVGTEKINALFLIRIKMKDGKVIDVF